MRVFRVKGAWGTKRVNEKKLRRKIQKRSYSGLEYIREEGSSRWQMLARTALFAEEVPVEDDPELLGLRRVLLAKDTIIGAVLMVTMWSALALPILLSGEPEIIPPMIFSAFVTTAMLFPLVYRAVHALTRFYLRGDLSGRRMRRPKLVSEDVYTLIEQLEREIEVMGPSQRRRHARKLEVRLDALRQRLRAQREAEQEVDAIEDPYMASRAAATPVKR